MSEITAEAAPAPVVRAYSNRAIHSKKRTITRRGVLWLGQTCNIRCHFCYFLDRINDKTHIEHAFMDFEKAKHICSTLRYKYDNNAIDIQGGEPTIYKHIYDLISHCHDIGLMPTLITNAVSLAEITRCERLKAAGLRDLLVSIQGIGETYDKIVGLPGGSEKQFRALANFKSVGIPVRFNVVLSKSVLLQLPEIAQLAVDSNAGAVNFLAFNPFEDQANDGKRSAFNVPTYTEVAKSLNEALDVLDAAHVEANVRYFPICMIEPRHRKSMYNFQQLPYDLHEWDYASWSWTGQQPQRMRPSEPTKPPKLRDETYPRVAEFYKAHPELDQDTLVDRSPEIYRDNAKMRASQHCGYKYSDGCMSCSLQSICDGFHGDYVRLFGMDEARPITDIPPVSDPTHYIANQDKILEEEDWNWVLNKEPANVESESPVLLRTIEPELEKV
jgi:molybdenum cofactor biosynthesis enzyme MoaA